MNVILLLGAHHLITRGGQAWKFFEEKNFAHMTSKQNFAQTSMPHLPHSPRYLMVRTLPWVLPCDVVSCCFLLTCVVDVVGFCCIFSANVITMQVKCRTYFLNPNNCTIYETILSWWYKHKRIYKLKCQGDLPAIPWNDSILMLFTWTASFLPHSLYYN